MRRFARSVLSLLLFLPASTTVAGAPTVVSASRHDTSAPLGQLAGAARAPKPVPDKQGLEPRPTGPALSSGRVDPVASELAETLQGVTSVIGFDGQSAADNRRVLGSPSSLPTPAVRSARASTSRW